MSADVVIRAENLGKKYIIGREFQRERYVALRDVLAQTARNVTTSIVSRFRGEASSEGKITEEFWALKAIDFEVRRGEVLGIIGRNGAGKSTLLKILSRITEPSEGRVTIKGRVASLLEVGTGFHPELTGRENIYLNGAVLGMTRAEVRRQFDAIVDFADVERFLDTPVKRYSSGMYVRLAFAVAAHLQPDILVVDEVLAVGDAEFQKKCLGKMESIAAGTGKAILFVSHNMTAIANLCQIALMLEKGELAQSGDSRSVIAHYLSSGGADAETRALSWPDKKTAPGDDRARVHRVEIINNNNRNGPLTTESPLTVLIEHWNLCEGANTIVEVLVRAIDDSIVFHSFSKESFSSETTYSEVGLFRTECVIPGDLLTAGLFRLEASILHGKITDYFTVKPFCAFSLVDTSDRSNLGYYGRFAGYVHPKLEWRASLVHKQP